MTVALAAGYGPGSAPVAAGDGRPSTQLVAPSGVRAADTGTPWAERDRPEMPSKAIKEDRKCGHVKANAERCGSFKVGGTDFCLAHMKQLGLSPKEK